MKWYKEAGFCKIRIHFDDLNHLRYFVAMARLNDMHIHNLSEHVYKSTGDGYIEGFVKEPELGKIESYLVKGRDYFKPGEEK